MSDHYDWREVPATPIPLVEDNDGNLHWKCDQAPPVTLVDIHALPFGKWLKLEEGLGRITITLDGIVVVYERVGRDLHGHWLCNLRSCSLSRDHEDDGRTAAERTILAHTR